ncbi:HIG1 domain family member 2A, mitochondrial [Trichoplax sp. H2]|nr:HIG1 domain family member 2A, mitochondrial [Trichoplax sp. H2]|eukprot:RDD40530.1 HIG1 domain family member 2A, mitochondrial [Trichoplax sp. H2]
MVGIERDPAKDAERHARTIAHREAILQGQKGKTVDENAKNSALVKEAEERAAAFQALKEAKEQSALEAAKQPNTQTDSNALMIEETPFQKLLRKFKENPFVPLGMLATTVALSYGLVNFRRGDQKMSQMMMRARVGAQGATILAVIGGLLVSGQRTVFGKEN